MQGPPSFDQRMGKAMLAAAWIGTLGVLALGFNVLLEHERNPNQRPRSHVHERSAIVTLEPNRNGHYLATGSLDGVAADFLIDTGASGISIPAELAKRANLRAGLPLEVDTAGGRVTVYACTIQEVRIGDIVLRGLRAHINPHAEYPEILLGMNFLRKINFRREDANLVLEQRQ